MSYDDFVSLTNQNFISVAKYHLDPNNQAEIVTDFDIDYTRGRRVVAAFDVDNFLTLPPHLYMNTLEELRKLNKQVRQNFDEIIDLAEKASDSSEEDVRRFDPFIRALDPTDQLP